MFTSRLALAAATVLALAVGTAGMALAQEDADTIPSVVVVTEMDTAWDVYGTSELDPGGFTRVYDRVQTATWDATDPRLSGEMSNLENTHRYRRNDVGALWANRMTVANDEGSWTGTGYGVWTSGAESGEWFSVVLEGAGAYEGLTAYLNSDYGRDGLWRGVIVADGMPPMPDPPAE